MDPFNKLPPEVRLMILIFTHSKRTIKRLIQASPTMLGQYVAYKDYVNRTLLAIELDDDDIIQDMMACILFPPRIEDAYDSALHYEHWVLWTNRRFPNPLQKKLTMNEKDQSLMSKLIKLYHKMLMFVEDYLAKATAARPFREYLCLPNPAGQLVSKDYTVGTVVDVAQCNDTEFRRLLKAFLRFELICQFYSCGFDYWQNCCYHLTEGLEQSEKEAIACVQIYFDSLYRAVITQCGDRSDLPECPTGILAEIKCDFDIMGMCEPWRLQTPDPVGKVSFNGDELCRWLACFGYDLAIAVVAATTAGQRGRVIVRQWLQDLATRGAHYHRIRPIFFRRPTIYYSGAHRRQDIFAEESGYLRYESYHKGPGLYQMLYIRFAVGLDLYTKEDARRRFQSRVLRLYRLRGWTFFDDARLFKSQGNGSQEKQPHFPADDSVLPAMELDNVIGPRRTCRELQYNEQLEEFSPEIEIRKLSRAITRAKI
ncbi:hypothetical protein F4777DRAFT_547516 [Nemania sp. FL0916]|nr:hypothetical protein F4777DRAFT_547516 [Nemania sp. FL0916]